METFADLHNHTKFSDGDYSPEQLVKTAKEEGIQVLGVTDHDTLGGIEDALIAGDTAGIEVIPGVEVSIRFNRSFFTGTLHVLVYLARERMADNTFVQQFETLLLNGRGQGLVRARIERINAVFGLEGQAPLLKRNLVFEDIAAYTDNASRRHFALALDEKLGIDSKDTINQIIGNASPAYLPSGIDLETAMTFIRKEHLVAVLAHPAAGSFPGKGHYKEVLPTIDIVEKLLPEFLDCGLQGLEVFYPGHSDHHQQVLLGWAETHNLLVTGGSDCHDVSERPFGVRGISKIEFLKLKEAIECGEKKNR